MLTSEVITQARALVDTPDKWFKGPGFPPQSKCCVGVAFQRVPVSHDSQCCGWKLLCAVIGMDGVAWNDQPERTHADVLAAFDKAIELAKAEEVKP